jgi:hypothetical protein
MSRRALLNDRDRQIRSFVSQPQFGKRCFRGAQVYSRPPGSVERPIRSEDLVLQLRIMIDAIDADGGLRIIPAAMVRLCATEILIIATSTRRRRIDLKRGHLIGKRLSESRPSFAELAVRVERRKLRQHAGIH